MKEFEREQEIKNNFEALKKWLPHLLLKYGYGKYALIRHRELVDVFDTKTDALKAAQLKFDDGLFSVQEITDVDLNVGFYAGMSCPL